VKEHSDVLCPRFRQDAAERTYGIAQLSSFLKVVCGQESGIRAPNLAPKDSDPGLMLPYVIRVFRIYTGFFFLRIESIQALTIRKGLYNLRVAGTWYRILAHGVHVCVMSV
jgi:hypothetical protein